MTVALCVIVAAGGLLASNMGFKLNYRLNATSPGVSATGKNTLALPYFRQTGQNVAYDMIIDIGGGSVGAVANVSKFNEINDTFTVYNGRMGAPAVSFSLAAGEGYFVNMLSNVNYIVVGSHDPSLAIQLDAATPGVSATGKNFLAPPYNITATNAYALMLDIGSGSVAPILNVSKFNTINDTFTVYNGRMGAPAASFALAPGEAYFVNMSASVPYTPSHY
jgi:hypothetical protein